MMSSPAKSPFRHPPFLFYFATRSLSQFAYQIGGVAIGWQVYALTGSAFELGMVGLVQFLPTLLLTFVAGHVADRYDRRLIVLACQSIQMLAAGYLAWAALAGRISAIDLFAAVALFGVAIAFEGPARSALLAAVTPPGQLQKASAITTSAMQIAIIGGPAAGGFAYAVSSAFPYLLMTAFWVLAATTNLAIRLDRPIKADREKTSWKTLFAGAAFVRGTPAILGTISLDLFAVLLGGATALMPIYARDILHTDAWGLGVLRGAPAVGAFIMGAWIARHPIAGRAGLRMFQAVIGFGVATLIFGLSQWFWLSVLALVLIGAFDAISVVIRVALVQTATPDEMRGRVGAINFLFINTSNQLGEFESGVVASLVGAVPAVILGGVGTIAIAFLWMRLFPTLKDWDRLD